jgi:hypothetical protein
MFENREYISMMKEKLVEIKGMYKNLGLTTVISPT